eukprot:TRINITY_DN4098_c0_g1_i1.p1 TRINITY_DN4098_c0_g1~~TRINITY_DN4098_c0_g1_i1.p1  ORF type:complete len:450 (+),score=63.59 TRINITY_DN4098_c0_g1_i1:91-1440(+)
MAISQNPPVDNKPKTSTAENGLTFAFQNKQTDKATQPFMAVRASYDNCQLISDAKKNQNNYSPSFNNTRKCDQQQQQKKKEIQKNQAKHEIQQPQQQPQQSSEQLQKSKFNNNGSQARHVRNYTHDLNTKQNAQQKQQREQKEAPSNNLSTLVTSVKFGQGFQTDQNYCPQQDASQKAITPIIQEIDVMPFQELYYVPKVLESFMRNTEDYFVQLFREHLMQSLQTVHFTNFLKPINPQILQSKQITLDKVNKKKTIIFDLDETLIHCNESLDIPSDIILPICFPSGEQISAGVNIRPYAKECLETLSNYYEIIVFTASHSCYANVVLDYLDPDNKYISYRLFRENCIQTEEGIYVKDLRIFQNRNLEHVLLVDNATYSFANHLNNGIPIVPYYDNQEDTELKDLTNYLIQLVQYNNIMQINANVFKFCLLYTSPSPRDRQKSRMPSSA